MWTIADNKKSTKTSGKHPLAQWEQVPTKMGFWSFPFPCLPPVYPPPRDAGITKTGNWKGTQLFLQFKQILQRSSRKIFLSFHSWISPSMWPEKNCQMSIKVAQNMISLENDRFYLTPVQKLPKNVEDLGKLCQRL